MKSIDQRKTEHNTEQSLGSGLRQGLTHKMRKKLDH